MPEFLTILRPAREGFPVNATEEEIATVGRHFNYLKGLLSEGKLVLAGRTLAEHPIGLAIWRVDSETEARALMDNDPAIVGGVMIGELHPYAVALLKGED